MRHRIDELLDRLPKSWAALLALGGAVSFGVAATVFVGGFIVMEDLDALQRNDSVQIEMIRANTSAIRAHIEEPMHEGAAEIREELRELSCAVRLQLLEGQVRPLELGTRCPPGVASPLPSGDDR